MTRVAIYTCIVGEYDKPAEPRYLPEDFEWYCFTPSNKESEKTDFSSLSDAEINRYYKMHPEKVLPKEFEYSLYLDGNISIESPDFYQIIRNLITSGEVYAGIKHPDRDDVYEESYRIIRNSRDTIRNMKRVTGFLLQEKFPRHYMMMENNVIFRKHSDSSVMAFDNLWWEMFQKYPKRDQMTHSYCIWKTGLKPAYIFPEGTTARNTPLLCYTLHGKDSRAKDFSLKGRIKDALTLIRKKRFLKYLHSIGVGIKDL